MKRLVVEQVIALGDYIFPNQCRLCGRILERGLEDHICTWCLLNLPRTGFHAQQDHDAARTFWGRCQFEDVLASLIYRRRNPAQKLIHDMKYHNSRESGYFLGKILGQDLSKERAIKPDHLLVPVPIHPKKKKIRGYNQSLLICEGISKICRTDIVEGALIRELSRESQTRKQRFERFSGYEGQFILNDVSSIEGRKVWLIDDVITTGATMEACGSALLQVDGIRLSAAAVAFSSR